MRRKQETNESPPPSQLGREGGFEFTAAEWAAVLGPPTQGELTDDELERVAGGIGWVRKLAGKVWAAIGGTNGDSGGSSATGARG